MRNFLLWSLVSICGVGLIFDGQVRNDYYTAFSYLFPVNTKDIQDLADATRLVVGLAMSLSFLNIFSGIMFKLLSMIGLVVYSVVVNQSFILDPSIESIKEISSIAIHITLIFICMDSIINQIIKQETRSEREKTRKIVEAAKQKAQKSAQEVPKQKHQKSSPAPEEKQKFKRQNDKQQRGNEKSKKA